LTSHFKGGDSLFFVACSTQNIDRLVSVYRACLKSGRTFVIDPYTAFILDKLKSVSSNIPQYDWGKSMKVFFVPNSYTRKMAENKSLFKFRSAKITYDEIEKNRDKLVIKDSYTTRRIFAVKKNLGDTVLVYSMWEGYLSEVRTFWDKHKVPVTIVHSSGHAYIEELQQFVKAIKPEWVIPNHTFYPEKYSNIFGKNILILKDGVTVDL
jgi:ribonuclease J